MKLDINEMRKFAGLSVLTESRFREDDDDEGMSSAERELARKADADLKKKGINVKVNAEKDLEGGNKPKSEPAEKVEDKPKAAEPAAKAEGDMPPAEKAKKAASARAFLKGDPAPTRKEFFAKAADLGIGKNYAAIIWQNNKPSVKPVTEGFYFAHPHTKSFVLGENREMNQYQWIDPNSEFPMVIAESKEQADKIEKYMREIKNQTPVVTAFNLDVE